MMVMMKKMVQEMLRKNRAYLPQFKEIEMSIKMFVFGWVFSTAFLVAVEVALSEGDAMTAKIVAMAILALAIRSPSPASQSLNGMLPSGAW